MLLTNMRSGPKVMAIPLILSGDGPSRMVKWPTGSDGEPSSPNRGASAGVKARHFIFREVLRGAGFQSVYPFKMGYPFSSTSGKIAKWMRQQLLQ